MQNTENKISLTGNGNIVIQDSKNGNITINQNDPQLFEKLQKTQFVKNYLFSSNDMFILCRTIQQSLYNSKKRTVLS